MRIGLLGGTFNPIHTGHLKTASAIRSALKLDAVWFIPTGKAPHKEEAHTSRADRWEMVRLALQDHPHFKPCDVEIKRHGISYTVDTLTLLKKRHPKNTFFFIIGTDAFFNLPQWKTPDRLLQLCHFVIVLRNGSPYSAIPDLKRLDGINRDSLAQLDRNERKSYTFSPDDGPRLYFIRTPLYPISACEIRNRIQSGKSAKILLPQPVLSYIMNEALYKKREEDS